MPFTAVKTKEFKLNVTSSASNVQEVQGQFINQELLAPNKTYILLTYDEAAQTLYFAKQTSAQLEALEEDNSKKRLLVPQHLFEQFLEENPEISKNLASYDWNSALGAGLAIGVGDGVWMLLSKVLAPTITSFGTNLAVAAAASVALVAIPFIVSALFHAQQRDIINNTSGLTKTEKDERVKALWVDTLLFYGKVAMSVIGWNAGYYAVYATIGIDGGLSIAATILATGVGSFGFLFAAACAANVIKARSEGKTWNEAFQSIEVGTNLKIAVAGGIAAMAWTASALLLSPAVSNAMSHLAMPLVTALVSAVVSSVTTFIAATAAFFVALKPASVQKNLVKTESKQNDSGVLSTTTSGWNIFKARPDVDAKEVGDDASTYESDACPVAELPKCQSPSPR